MTKPDEGRFYVGQLVRHVARPGHFQIDFLLRIHAIYVLDHDVNGTELRRGMLIANCHPADAPDDNIRGFALSELEAQS